MPVSQHLTAFVDSIRMEAGYNPTVGDSPRLAAGSCAVLKRDALSESPTDGYAFSIHFVRIDTVG